MAIDVEWAGLYYQLGRKKQSRGYGMAIDVEWAGLFYQLGRKKQSRGYGNGNRCGVGRVSPKWEGPPLAAAALSLG